jgi:ATP-dependent helicase HrpB
MQSVADYPIAEILPALRASLAEHPRLVLEAPPGAGKTTQVPLALLSEAWCSGRILMLEPRRVAARAAATFMAGQLNEPVGATVGYRIRFERKVSAQTRIEIVTEGILTRLLQDDPLLEGVSAVLFDEFHERNLASDLGLALCLDVQAGVRPDLRLLVMSATLDGARLAQFLDAPRVTSAGRSYPVDVAHVPLRPRETPESQLRRAVELALTETTGDVLCFLAGKGEIDRALRLLAGLPVELCALHGEMRIEEQARVLAPGTTRRVVLATNVAESSVTLPGVRAVVDTGLAREPRFDPASGMSRLETVLIAQSSATQRAGRAGRVAPGRCYRLWPESQRLDAATRPELQQVELASFALEIAAWGASQLRFPDPPPSGALGQAQDLLRQLGALDADNAATAHGRALLELGLHPRLANALRRAPAALRGLACDVAAVLEARDPLRGESRRNDDLRPRLQALAAQRAGRSAGPDADRGALQRIDQASQQWRRRAGVKAEQTDDAHDTGEILALAYPDRIACQHDTDLLRYQLSNGRGARLHPESSLRGEPWLVVAELRQEDKDSLIQRAAPVSRRFLETQFPAWWQAGVELRFNRENRSVEATETQRFAGITLSQRARATPRDGATAMLLFEGILALGLDALPWTPALREWQARVQGLRDWCPELGLPAVSDEALQLEAKDWLLPLLEGFARVSELDAANLGEALRNRLDYGQRRQVDELAPVEIEVPSGQRRRLVYTLGEAPVLAVKLQEMFGLADTPRIARGRVPVVLHLLSPRQTPLQVTQDLRGFWERTYPEVKKEMKGRYPRHPWPDDPWTATATHRAKPRGT